VNRSPNAVHHAGPRLCIVNASLPPIYGGAEIAAFRYSVRYNDAGGQVLLVGSAATAEQMQSLPDWVIPILERPPAGRIAPLRWLPGAAYLSMAFRVWPVIWTLRHRFDVLHIFNSSPLFNLVAVPLARLCGKPVVLEMSLRGSDDPLRLRVWGKPGRIPLLSRPPIKYLLFRMGNRFVAKSEALREVYLESGLSERALCRIPYAVDTRLYRQAEPPEKARLREKLGLDGSEVQVLYVGGLTPRKGVHWLVGAFARLPRGLSVGLVLVGPDYKYDPEYSNGLRAAVVEAGLNDRVSFVTGVSGNVDEYMRACDIFVLPSVREGLPISILEAMSSGLAVVASNIPEIADSQLEDGLEGHLFSVGDVEQLTSLLRVLTEDSDERRRLGLAARRRVEREFSVEVVDMHYQRLYAGLLGDGRRRDGGLARQA
jgi:glycosyltransferase involved in cell wall biosynthesis